MPDRSIFWFRRDLRLADNPALVAAAAAGPVLACFVLDPALYRPAGGPRRRFLAASLTDLDHRLDHRLSLVEGEPARALTQLAAQTGIERIYATADFGPYGAERDRTVAKALAGAGCEVKFLDSPYAVAPDTLATSSGTPFQVFTPFYKAWLAHGWDDPAPAPDVTWSPRAEGASSPSKALGAMDQGDRRPHGGPDDDAVARQWPVGEQAALDRLEVFLSGPVDHYDDDRNQPADDATSQLSPYLKWGAIHPRTILDQLGRQKGQVAFARQVAWREFYADVLYHRPESARQAYQPRMAAMKLDQGKKADQRFEAWTEGQTGYPIVDAGMRQLRTMGWVHNRVRLIVASFLVKDLHIDWTRGARWFMERLVDGDLASNNHGWQWVAGSGTDAAPYFRIFNPVSQGERFDPGGRYVRRWVPELASVPDRYVQRPWTDPGGPPEGYPAPIVDHDRERRESLDRYQRLRADASPDGAGASRAMH